MRGQIIGSLVRALLASLGGAALVSDAQIDQVIGAIGVLISVGWSIWSKYQAQGSAPIRR